MRDLNILIVQPDAVQARRLHHLLFDLGHESESLAHGQDALLRIQAGAPLDLLITELSLPGPDGLSLVAELRKRRSARQAAAIVVTSYPGLIPQAERLRHTLGLQGVFAAKTAALELTQAIELALRGKGESVALAPPPAAAFSASAPAQAKASSLARRVAGVHLAGDLELGESLARLAEDCANAFESSGAYARLAELFKAPPALHWKPKEPRAPAVSSPHWSLLAPRREQDQVRPLFVGDARKSVTLRGQPLIDDGVLGAFASAPIADSAGRTVGFISLLEARSRFLDVDQQELLLALAKRLGREVAASALLQEMRENLASQWQMAVDREEHLSTLKEVLQSLSPCTWGCCCRGRAAGRSSPTRGWAS